MLHPETIGGGLEEFEAAVEARSCTYLNGLGATALNEMREVYERLDAGDYDALGEIAERLAAAVEQKSHAEHQAIDREERPTRAERTAAAPVAEPEATSPARDTHEERRDPGTLIQNTLDSEEHDLAKTTPERAAPAIPESEAQGVLLAEPAPLPRPELPLLLSHVAANHLLRERLVRDEEAVQAPILETAASMPAPLPVEAAKRAIHTPRREAIEDRQEPEISILQSTAGQEQADHKITDTPESVLLSAELSALGPEPFAAAQEALELDEEEAEVIRVPEIADVLYYERAEQLGLVAEPGDEPAAEAEPGDTPSEPIFWPEITDIEPAQVYESFCQDLQLLVELSIEEPKPPFLDEMEVAGGDELVDAGEDQAVKKLPVIAIVVAERLSELNHDDKEAAALTVTDIVKKAHSIEILELEGGGRESVEAAKAKLEQSLTELFEQLRIEFEAEDVKEFMSVLLRPDFLPPQTVLSEVAAADLEHDGTREAKRHFPYHISGLMGVEDKMRRILGKLTLFYMLSAKPGFQTISG